jgi:hypothetical protein
MSGRTSRTPGVSITARPSPAEKARFSTLAHAAGISESRLALMAIRAFVDAEGRTQAPADYDPAAERVRATDRITIRLRPGDGAVIVRRARARGVKTATYLAAMARAHIAADPPLFAHELAALKESIATLSELGLLLGRNARSPALSAPGLEEVRQILSRTRAALAALEQRTHDFAKAALMAWESRFDE